MIELTSDAFVWAAYGLTFLILGGYGLSIIARRRSVERQMDAWSEDQEHPEAGALDGD